MMVILRRGPGALPWLAFACLVPSLAFAAIVNRTIDDSFGDSQTGLRVTYLPSVWNNEMCVGCAIKPDVTNAFDRTYTAATYHPNLGSMNITMQFNGTAIYVFFILVNNAGSGVTTLTLANFTLDGNLPQFFQHTPDLTTSDFEFNQLVFFQTNLTNVQHTLVISTSGVKTSAFVNFDYAIYTHDDDPPSLGSVLPTTTSTSATPSLGVTVTSTSTAPPSVPTLGSFPNVKNKASAAGPIAGGAVGGFLIVALVSSLVHLYHRRRRTKWPNEREGEGHIPPLTLWLGPGRGQQVATVSPPFPMTLSNTEPQLANLEVESAYRSYITPGTSSHQTSSACNSPPFNSHVNNHEGQILSPPRYTMIEEQFSPAENMITTISLQTPINIEAIRSGEEGPTVEEEMNMSDMRKQIAYLQSQLRSACAHGLPVNPPPRYTSVWTSSRYSTPPPRAALSKS